VIISLIAQVQPPESTLIEVENILRNVWNFDKPTDTEMGDML
jgi:hypothetical protein